jgi:hypothetical protein
MVELQQKKKKKKKQQQPWRDTKPRALTSSCVKLSEGGRI